jgi:hypothetical protein
MLHDPFLYDFVAEHQRALREAAARAGGVGGLGQGWSWLSLGVSAAAGWGRMPAVASRGLVCGRLLQRRYASGQAFVGHDA